MTDSPLRARATFAYMPPATRAGWRSGAAALALLAPLAGCSAVGPLPSPPAAGGCIATCDAGAATDAAPPVGGAVDGGGLDASPQAPDAGPPDAGPPPPPAALLSTDDLSQALSSVPLTRGESGQADAIVTLDVGTTYQSVVGFGASITDSSSYVMTTYLSSTALQATVKDLFDPVTGIGLSFLRQPMGASDFSSVGNFSYDDGNADPTLANFTVAQDLKATIPVLKQALAVRPSLFIMGTPWSPPAWMKNNGSMDGSGGAPGNAGLATSAYAPLAQYFVKFVQAYAAAGVPVGAITPQNEPLNGSATYPGMDFNAGSELSLIAQDLGPAFQAAGLSTLIWAYDHNWDTESYPAQIMGDATAGGFSEGAAFHCYGGDVSAMTTFHEAFPDKSVYMTECSGGGWQDDPFANTIDLVIDSMNNWARAISLWNLALDEKAGPQNAGCPDCRGVITVDSKSGAVTKNADYYALGHLSKFVQPGALRVASKSSNGSLDVVAFVNGDGRVAVIGHNQGTAALAVRVGAGATALNVSVPANAAVTVAWTP